jgi:ABC-2 type transport system permease protein
MSKTRFIIIKEFRHILRDPRSLVIAIIMPILMTLLYGYAVNLDTKNIKLAVIDEDKSAHSRALVNSFYQSGYFIPPLSAPQINDLEGVLRAGHAHAVLVLRRGFSEAVRTQEPYQVGLVVDGSDANRAAAATNYSNVLLFDFIRRNVSTPALKPWVWISPRVLYNPDLRSPDFFVPGLIAIILMMISALLTSITIVREKETGTMEQLMTAPVAAGQIITGKVVPYIGIAFIDGFLIILFAIFHFHVPFEGSYLLLALFGVIYVTAALSIGVVISTLVRSQLAAMMTALMVTVMPSVMLSGFIFEIKNMPLPLQYLSMIIPARHFIIILRGVMLKGVGAPVLWRQTTALVILTAVLLGIAARRFKLKLG